MTIQTLKPKTVDIIGLVLAAPTAAFCVDEKTATQALDRLEPVLPFHREPSPLGEAHPHRPGQSVGPQEVEEEFLGHNPKVPFYFTPTYSSWLNQVELWFAKIPYV